MRAHTDILYTVRTLVFLINYLTIMNKHVVVMMHSNAIRSQNVVFAAYSEILRFLSVQLAYLVKKKS